MGNQGKCHFLYKNLWLYRIDKEAAIIYFQNHVRTILIIILEIACISLFTNYLLILIQNVERQHQVNLILNRILCVYSLVEKSNSHARLSYKLLFDIFFRFAYPHELALFNWFWWVNDVRIEFPLLYYVSPISIFNINCCCKIACKYMNLRKTVKHNQ